MVSRANLEHVPVDYLIAKNLIGVTQTNLKIREERKALSGCLPVASWAWATGGYICRVVQILENYNSDLPCAGPIPHRSGLASVFQKVPSQLCRFSLDLGDAVVEGRSCDVRTSQWHPLGLLG